MKTDALLLALLAAFLLLFGLFSVTNVEVVWGRPLMGLAALAAGVVAAVAAFRNRP